VGRELEGVQYCQFRDQSLMSTDVQSANRLAFGLFEADLKAGELWKSGRRIKLQTQPFKVLTVLLEHAGEVVSREDLQRRVWVPDVVVDFEHSLSSAIKKIREALSDDAENPRFIETLSKRGYRFIAPVSVVAEVQFVREPAKPAPIAVPVTAVEQEAELKLPSASVRLRYVPRSVLLLAGVAFASFFLGASAFSKLRVFDRFEERGSIPRIVRLTQTGRVYSSVDTAFESLPATVTDGIHLYTSTVEDGRDVLSQLTISTGEMQTLTLPSEIASPEINDISPDKTQLLVRSHLSAEAEEPLWVIPVAGGYASRVANLLAHDATWMPDGRSILYAYGNQLNVVSLESSKSTPFATVEGRAFWLRWSPDGSRLRFTIIDSINHTSSLWEISGGNHRPHPLLTSWTLSPNACCGVWTADGRDFVFQVMMSRTTDLWRLSGIDTSHPLRMTNGPFFNESPAGGRNQNEIFFVGHDYQSQSERMDPQTRQFVPLQGFLAHAEHVSYSRDHRFVLWLDPMSRLWRAQADGQDKVQLTPNSLHVFLANWSPDGANVTLMARRPGCPWQIFVVNANGENLRQLMREDYNVADPSFSADGKSIVFGGIPDLMGQGDTPRSIDILDLAGNRVTELPGSKGLFSPRWSPDGQLIAALTLDQQKIMLYDVKAQSWRVLAVTSAADPVWSSDSRSLYFHAYMAPLNPVSRVEVSSGHIEPMITIKNFPAGTVSRYFFSGLTPDDAVITNVALDNSNLYSLELDPAADSQTH
jgi:Tol biopolymer transport system component/DNA-binding winged helix-turn-helix (wHTH) protein